MGGEVPPPWGAPSSRGECADLLDNVSFRLLGKLRVNGQRQRLVGRRFGFWKLPLKISKIGKPRLQRQWYRIVHVGTNAALQQKLLELVPPRATDDELIV